MPNKDKTSVYEWEYTDSFERIWSQRRHLPEIKYFLDTEYAWAKNRCRPNVVILGTDIPEELVYACSAAPFWLTGGSLASTVWSDELVPRDTDPVSRSVLGYIHKTHGADFSDSLYIIPLVSDSMRKIAYQLKADERKLCLVDIPPDRSGSGVAAKWQRQMLDMVKAISEHTGTRISRSSVITAAKKVSKARYALNDFLNISRGRPDLISDAARLMICDSYYRTFNIDEWTYRLQILAAKTAELAKRYAYVGQSRPKVMVMGSPIVFPNYKIPFLIDDAGLELIEAADSSSLKRYLVHGRKDLRGGRDRIIRGIAARAYECDASSAFVSNDALYRYMCWRVQRGDIEGVVYHVLKGQIEQDFELERYETLFSNYGIPVFRLETDYQYQDIEQLRIRLEAFSEMLKQNRYKGVKQAK